MWEGSPPRVRGKLVDSFDWIIQGRITPACAGKTAPESDYDSNREDHPRVCGENSGRFTTMPRTKGSPPRVRGKRKADATPDTKPGITPACAGKTVGLSRALHLAEDHPRVCGENASPPSSQLSYKGSPPRVRGKLPIF